MQQGFLVHLETYGVVCIKLIQAFCKFFVEEAIAEQHLGLVATAVLGLDCLDVVVNDGVVDVALTFQRLQIMVLYCEHSDSVMIWIPASEALQVLDGGMGGCHAGLSFFVMRAKIWS